MRLTREAKCRFCSDEKNSVEAFGELELTICETSWNPHTECVYTVPLPTESRTMGYPPSQCRDVLDEFFGTPLAQI